MKKISKFWALIMLVLVSAVVALSINTANCITANKKLRKQSIAYINYYKASEKLFDEVEDSVGEFVFDTDRGADYLDARKIVQENQ